MDHDAIIEQECRRLSFRIAVARDQLKEAILQGTPLDSLTDVCNEISICLLQRTALRDGRFNELPYNIKLLFT